MDISKMMAQAKKLQAEIEKQERTFAAQVFNYEKQGIRLKMTGALTIASLELDPLLVDPDDRETLQDLITITLNEAIAEISAAREAIKTKAAQGML